MYKNVLGDLQTFRSIQYKNAPQGRTLYDRMDTFDIIRSWSGKSERRLYKAQTALDVRVSAEVQLICPPINSSRSKSLVCFKCDKCSLKKKKN